MSNPAVILVFFVVFICGFTAISFFRRAVEVNTAKAKSMPKAIVKAVRFRYNLIMGVIMAFFAISGLVWVFKNL
jgi:hypothetical protein